MNWTEEQSKAIYTDGNIILSASAGSGKTAVLTERVVRLVEQGNCIQDMLIVTFTNPAAAEMKQRIEKRLYERANEVHDEKVRAHIHRQSQEVFRANICTVHSFCLKLLREYFYLLSLSPSFKILDDTDAELLMDECKTELLEKYYIEQPDGLKKLMKLLLDNTVISSKKYSNEEERLLSIITKIYETIRSIPNGWEWLDKSVRAYDPSDPSGRDDIDKLMLFYIQKGAFFALKALLYMKKIVGDDIVLPPDDSIQARIMKYSEILEAKDFDALYEIIDRKIGSMNIKRGKLYSDEQKAQLSEIWEVVKPLLDSVDKNIKEYKALDSDESIYPEVELLGDMVRAFDEIYSKKKLDRSAVDFSDMEIMAHSLLKRQDIAEDCKKQFKYILVDEYQDISRLQDDIINTIKGDDASIFFVGDMKQAIYRFRNAEPSLFSNREKKYETSDEGKAMFLSANFRSSDAVIDFTNYICGSLFSESASEVTYDEKNRLLKKGSAGKGTIELCILENPKKEDSENSDAEGDNDAANYLKEERQALYIAQRIHELMNDGQIYDPSLNCNRKYRYSDFAILMRKVTKDADAYVQVFTLEGIPIYVGERDGYFSAIEVKILINLLSIIDNRRQDIPLLSVMRTPIGGFTIDEIATMRCDFNERPTGVNTKGKGILDCLIYESTLNTPLGAKADKFLKLLDDYYDESLVLPLEDLIVELLDVNGFSRFISALPGGKERVMNLYILREYAKNFEQNIGGGLSGFISYLKSIESVGDLKTAKTASSDAVQFTTIHKSKGLEYNVVILPSLEKEILSHKNSKDPVLVDKDYGIGIKYSLNGKDKNTPQYQALLARETARSYADELRLLYVALTRAKDRLILISAPVSDKNFFSDEVLSLLGEDSALNVKNYIDWFMLALLGGEHKDAVRDFMLSGEDVQISDTLLLKHSELKLNKQSNVNSDFEALKLKAYRMDVKDQSDASAWRYPYEQDVDIPSKASATELSKPKTYYFEWQKGFKRERIKAKDGSNASATERGNAMHRFMSLVTLKDHDESSIETELSRLTSLGKLTEREAGLIDPQKALAFFESDLGQRLLKSKKVLREKQFACLMPADSIMDVRSKEKVLIQGVIDCCFMEENANEWTVIDYKTDSLEGLKTPSEIENYARERHGNQVELYSRALEILTGIQAASSYIYLFNYGAVRVF